jgi:hypothetical protein
MFESEPNNESIVQKNNQEFESDVNSGICDSKELFKRIIIEFELKKNKD